MNDLEPFLEKQLCKGKKDVKLENLNANYFKHRSVALQALNVKANYSSDHSVAMQALSQ